MKTSSLLAGIFVLLLSFSNCNSSKPLKSNQSNNKFEATILLLIESMNSSDRKGLEKVYAENYEGIFPIVKFENKSDLIDQLISNQKKQKLKIEFEILEISAKKEMAYALLDWKAIANFGTIEQEELYHKKHFQIWVKSKDNWQLSRSIFY